MIAVGYCIAPRWNRTVECGPCKACVCTAMLPPRRTTPHVGLLLFAHLALTRAQVPDQPLLKDPPPRQSAHLNGSDAPLILNSGHDFVLAEWPARPGQPIGHQVVASRWAPSFLARHAPILSGVYAMAGDSGETFELCTRRERAANEVVMSCKRGGNEVLMRSEAHISSFSAAESRFAIAVQRSAGCWPCRPQTRCR